MLSSVCCVRHLEYNAKRKLALTRLVGCTVQTSEPTSKTRHFVVSYRVWYRDTVSGYVLYRGKIYRCRPVPSGFVTDAVPIPRNLPILRAKTRSGD